LESVNVSVLLYVPRPQRVATPWRRAARRAAASPFRSSPLPTCR